jgi:hypothetical protein
MNTINSKVMSTRSSKWERHHLPTDMTAKLMAAKLCLVNYTTTFSL